MTVTKDYPFLRQVKSPVTDAQLSPLDPRCKCVQFAYEDGALHVHHRKYPQVHKDGDFERGNGYLSNSRMRQVSRGEA